MMTTRTLSLVRVVAWGKLSLIGWYCTLLVSCRTSAFVMGSRSSSRASWGLGPMARSFSSVSSLQQSSTTTTAAAVEPEARPVDDTTTSLSGTRIVASDEDFVKPLLDRRQYRSLVLQNNLQVLLVSAPDSDTEAASVHVKAGHFDDPPAHPGLAHFHEHMLFLGTQKYPDENEYEAYLQQHGGSSNAYTDMEDTNYYMSLTPHTQEDDDESNNPEKETVSPLEGALDRLAQFFVSPLFLKDMVERELRAVDSEYRNSLSSDAWRQFQLLKSASHPNHSFHKFGCGNYETLTRGGSIVNATHSTPGLASPQPALFEFWNQHYVTTNLRLCVVGQASLDDLQTTVERTFGQLPHSEEAEPPPKVNAIENDTLFSLKDAAHDSHAAFGPGQLGKVRETKPLQESRVLKVHFATPPLDDPLLKQTKPYRVISHLLGHESRGSLHALLNEEGLLNGLSSGIGIDTSDFSFFSLTLALTPKGMQQREKILDTIFQWIALIRQANEDGKMAAYHDELCEISKTNFLFRENGDPTDFCSAASELMFDYEPSQILVGSSSASEYDPVVATEFLKRLLPENALITVVDPDLSEDEGEWQTEEWYGAKYRDTPIPEHVQRRWESPPEIDPRLQLPGLNEYIAKDFSLRCDDPEASLTKEEQGQDGSKVAPPRLLLSRPYLRMWHKMDRTWRVPKTDIHLSILSPTVYRSPRTMTLSRIYQRVLNDDLNSFVYDASVAGCYYRVSNVPTGYRLSVKGYSEKMPFLLDTLIARMLSLIEEMKEGPSAHPGLALKFNKACEGLLRETKNYRLETPYEVASYNARLVLEKDVWYVDDYINEMEGELADKDPLTMEECARIAQECLCGRKQAEALCLGNINEEGAQKVAEVVERNLFDGTRPLLDQETPVFRSLKMPTRAESKALFGEEAAARSSPLIYQELSRVEAEENSCVELVLQTGCDFELGFEGVATLELLSHIAYNSAFSQLRTKEQLGYIVSASARKSAGGSWALSVVVQSSVAEPSVLEERIEAWLELYRQELEDMDPEDLAAEARAVVAQLRERDTKLSQEVARFWDAIVITETLSEPLKEHPPFDRLEKVATELTVANGDSVDIDPMSIPQKTASDLKAQLLVFFDRYLAADSPERRVLSSRLYSQNHQDHYEENVGKPGILSHYAEIGHLKQFLSTWPMAPYWATVGDSEPAR